MKLSRDLNLSRMLEEALLVVKLLPRHQSQARQQQSD
jgi:hypothetical protein